MGQASSKGCLFCPAAEQGKGKESAFLGTPLPNTPVVVRRKRQQVKDALYEDRPAVISPLINKSLREETTIHDGPDAEKQLHEKYQMMEVLGVGSTSTVHQCRNKVLGRDYACKVVNCSLIEERFSGMMEQFQTEIHALKDLIHPGIIQLYDVYVTDENIYIVMELMEGGELFDYVVQKGTLTEEEASKIVRKITSALSYMHSKNYIHRDLKPENLLLKREPRPGEDIDVKIIDFGLSKAMEEQPVTGTFLGTRGYLSPEQLSRSDYTKAVDCWALGVIIFGKYLSF
jgi:serine/threonine protein kinase